ncbi:hypothetical protein, partial [Pseudomonas syringae group genomosp. 3]
TPCGQTPESPISDADLQRFEYPLFLKGSGSTRSDQTEGTRTGIKFVYATQITRESCITLHCSGIEPICRINSAVLLRKAIRALSGFP